MEVIRGFPPISLEKTHRLNSSDFERARSLKDIWPGPPKPPPTVKGVSILEIEKIDEDKYHYETMQRISTILDYNRQVYKAIQDICNLRLWNETINFGDAKYGIPGVFNGLHRKDNCFGEIEEKSYKICRCWRCRYWKGCKKPMCMAIKTCARCAAIVSRQTVRCRKKRT